VVSTVVKIAYCICYILACLDSRGDCSSSGVGRGVPVDFKGCVEKNGRGEASSYRTQGLGVGKQMWRVYSLNPLSSEVLSTPDGSNVAQFESTH